MVAGFLGIDVVDDEEVAGMGGKPADGGGDADFGFLFILFREVEEEEAGEGGEGFVDGAGAGAAEEEAGGVAVGEPAGVFDGEPGLADAAGAVDELDDGTAGDGAGSRIGGEEALPEGAEDFVAAGEEGADGVEGNVFRGGRREEGMGDGDVAGEDEIEESGFLAEFVIDVLVLLM